MIGRSYVIGKWKILCLVFIEKCGLDYGILRMVGVVVYGEIEVFGGK